MPKRYLTVRNQGNEDAEQQQQASAIGTRSSSKRASTNEPIPAKKAKVEEKQLDKENVPPSPSHQSEDEENHLIAPVNIEHEGSDDESEEENPTSSVADRDEGEEHPTNKQYLIYKHAKPNKEPYIISKTARYWSLKYRKVLCHVNPDFYGMYIHNDFSSYGELEVVENCLLDLTKTIFFTQRGITMTGKTSDKINYPLAFRRLEALTILLDYTDGISGIDDGERFYDIMRVIGACYVTILRGLLPKIMFEKIETFDDNLVKKLKKISKQLPNFKQVLEQALIVGHGFLTSADVCTAYTKIVQIVYCNWLLVLEKTSIDFNEPSNDFNPNLWTALKHAFEIDPNDIEYDGNESFDFKKELRIYKELYGLGGHSHDLSKWSRSDREAYALGRGGNPFIGFWF